SSRRRHTRCYRDWSSDVCSSDLAYLVFLGLQALRAALFTKGDLRELSAARATVRLKRRVAYRQGLLSNLSNPKIVVFFLSLLPQFIDRGQASFERLLLLGLIFCAIAVSWLSLYAVVVARVGDFLRRDRVRRALEAVTGLALVGLGLKLVTDRRVLPRRHPWRDASSAAGDRRGQSSHG